MEQHSFPPRQQVKRLLHEQVIFVHVLTATRLYYFIKSVPVVAKIMQ